MQAELGGPITLETIPVHYAYVARYSYSDVVVQNDNFLRLSAFSDSYQTPGPCEVATFPQGRQIQYPDHQGNTVHRVRVTAPHRELIIAATGQVSLNHISVDAPDIPLSDLQYGLESNEFLTPSRLADPEGVSHVAIEAQAGATTLMQTVHNVVTWIHANVAYERGHTSVNTTAADVLTSMRGVCQDQAHLCLAMLRAVGVPARYVSGLLTRQPGETHAWVDFLHPQLGWLPADPTRGNVIDLGTDYLRFGIGRDYSEVPPVTGSFISRGNGQLDFTTAEVFFDRASIAVEDALGLLNRGGSTP